MLGALGTQPCGAKGIDCVGYSASQRGWDVSGGGGLALHDQSNKRRRPSNESRQKDGQFIGPRQDLIQAASGADVLRRGRDGD